MKNLSILGGSQKNLSFRWVHEKPIYIGGLPEKGGLGQFSDLRRTWYERGGGAFEGADTPMHITGFSKKR